MPHPHESAPARAEPAGAPRQLRVDLLIAVAVLVAAGVWGARFFNTWTARGGQPVFYQAYFEPAVMIACGKGFVISEHQPKPLEDFLFLRRDTFDCRDLPADLKLGREHLYQEAWTYLQTTVGWSWRVLGISWSRMGPLFGLLFGTVVAVAYGTFRLGMGRLLALLCAFGLAISTTQLLNLPHLRDYSKAPFTLGLVLILGLLVTRPVRARTVLTLAAAYGVVLGIGYGFRTDLLANLPIIVAVLFGFLEGGVTRHLRLKVAATALFLATFAIVSWPATSAVYKKGGCQWHVALLGLQTPFDPSLGIVPAPYDFGHAYSDEYIERVVDGYARRMRPAGAPLVFCSHEYDVESGAYLSRIVATFPGDMIARAYASVLQIAELPFAGWVPPMNGWATSLYAARAALLRPTARWGAVLIGAAILMTSAASLRLGAFLLFFVAYFGGYPAIQFQERHHFHLEFMTWWAMGFVLQQTASAARSAYHARPPIRRVAAGAFQAAAFGAAALVACGGALLAARWHQAREARQLFQSYIAAPKVPLDQAASALPEVSGGRWPQYLEVDLHAASCGPRTGITFRDDAANRSLDFTRTMVVDRPARATGVIRVLTPVFERFRQLEFTDLRPDCVAGVYRFADISGVPLLLGAVLQPKWETGRLYQRIASLEPGPAAGTDFERDPEAAAFHDLPALTTWTPIAGAHATKSFFGSLRVQGDRTTAGYQMTSPAVTAPEGARVFIRTNLTATEGRVCLGALDAKGAKWLAPADTVRQKVSFVVDGSRGFLVTIANCNAAELDKPSRFSLSRAAYAIELPERN